VAKQSLQRSGEKLAESAEKIKHSTYGVEDSAERRTQSPPTARSLPLSAPTLLGTGLLALASGIGAKALLSEVIPEWLIIATGSILLAHSVLGQQYGAISSRACLRRESMCHASPPGF
jgi:putative membrane protein